MNIKKKVFVKQSTGSDPTLRSGDACVRSLQKGIPMMHADVSGFFTLSDTDNDDVHLLLGQPKKMMHDPACKLF